jgi:putative RNA 2'-phosphotransferase
VTEHDLTMLSKAIARVLRHRPDAAGVRLDKQGWCRIDELLEGLARAGTLITRAQLDDIVRTSDKQRFTVSPDGQLIRAAQGHSVPGVELQLRQKTPPDVLYHGTVAAALAAVRRKGLLPMRRHHVHLSADVAAATAVGERRGTPVVLEVDAHRMLVDGHRFWVSDNGVWLAPSVPPKYLTLMKV